MAAFGVFSSRSVPLNASDLAEVNYIRRVSELECTDYLLLGTLRKQSCGSRGVDDEIT